MEDKINPKERDRNSPKKRVLFIITQSEFGGAQQFLSQLITRLETGRFELAIVSGSDGNKEIKNMLPKSAQYISAKRLHRNPNIFSDITSLFELKKIIKDFQPDTLFLNSSKAGFIGSLALRLAQGKLPKIKVMYRIGGWTFNDPWPWWKKMAYRWLEKISASWKDYIIVNNKHDYEQALKYGIKPRQEVVLIHNGIDPYKLDFLEKDAAKIRLYELLPPSQKHASFLHEGLTIGTIANFYPTKGLEYLIEAFCKLKTVNPALAGKSGVNCKLVIIGDGPEREKLVSSIKYYGLENKVFLIGRIPYAYKYLQAFDVFVLPSVKEGFSWALLEAMSAKLPVIATAVGANPEIIENDSPSKNGFLVPSHNPQALADAIAKLATDESLRRELGIQAHQTVLHKFSLNKMVSQIEALL